MKLLIANRGEIALRVIRAARDLGWTTVAVYSDADEDCRHRFAADEALRLPGRTSAETYLQIPKIVDAIRLTRAEAVHPGFGFLSENADFATAVIQAGARFVGPTPAAIAKMGDKIAAKDAVSAVGVPIVPGSPTPLKSADELRAVVDKIGFPLILKAAAGGGGRGMRIVREDGELLSSLEACQREAQMYFGNPEVFCERYIEHGRHIEIQIMADQFGNTCHLFERDCTIQRRHQKLIEEAPSAYLNNQQRSHMGALAVAAAKAVGYQGAGTVEFICESPERFYFMEMNTRIQVEHPVTEIITGIDLVREQLLVAAGEKLSFKQEDIAVRGHAMELRINTEDPTRDFMPTPGCLSNVRLPSGPGIRVDSHLYSGYTVPQEYDSMVAKVIGYGRTRADVVRVLLRGLSETVLEGTHTNCSFHEALLHDPVFLSGQYTTRYLEEIWPAVKERWYGRLDAAALAPAVAEEGWMRQ